MRIAFAVFCALVLAAGALEWRRWRTSDMEGLMDRSRRMRRGAIFAAMLIVSAMALGGTFFPHARVDRRVALDEMLYWSVCFAVALTIPIAALRELQATLRQQGLRRTSDERNQAYRSMVNKIADVRRENARRRELPRRNGHE